MSAVPEQTWRFHALDSWFFRESRPMESLGGSELLSAFPPSPRTVSGVIRTIVGERHGVDWMEWRKPETYPELKTRIGDADGLGALQLYGPWLMRKTENGAIERLYPVPRNLLAKQAVGVITEVQRMLLGKPCHCDLGKKVRMAVAPKRDRKLRTPEDYWLSAEALQKVLAGGICQPDALIATHALFKREARLGIARNNATRVVETGLLYQTRHVRPRAGVWLETDVSGLQFGDHGETGIARFGGEGRGAAYSVHVPPARPMLKKIKANEDTIGILLVLLTHACIPTASAADKLPPPLPGFERDDSGDATVWKGTLHGIKLTLHGALTGKPVREGGWDLANHQPRSVQSLVPAGSVYYLSVDDGDIQAAIDTLHLQQLPAQPCDLALGRGLLAVGLWPANEFPKE